MSTLDQALAGTAPAIKIGSATIALTKPIATTTPTARPAPVGGSLTAGVNAALAKAKEPPKTLTLNSTKSLGLKAYMHALIYSETSARKTSTAAAFGNRDNTRFIITRRAEQLLPLRNLDYQYAEVTDGAALKYALQFPERLWPDWAAREDRILVIDDLTEAVTLLLEDNETIDGKEVRDPRRTYAAAGEDLRDALRSLLRKPLHLIIVALAKVRDNPISNEERVGPDLPPSMLNMLLAELEFCLYISPTTFKFTTERDIMSYTAPDPANPNREKTFKREIFGKHKLSKDLAMRFPKVIEKYENLDLRGLWSRVQGAEAEVTKAHNAKGECLSESHMKAQNKKWASDDGCPKREVLDAPRSSDGLNVVTTQEEKA